MLSDDLCAQTVSDAFYKKSFLLEEQKNKTVSNFFSTQIEFLNKKSFYTQPTIKSEFTLSQTENEKPIIRPWLAAFEVTAFNLGLHLFDRFVLNADYAQVTWESLNTNFKKGPVWDNDNISTNLFWHPYTGGLYFNAARANGMNFWQSIPYAFAGSLMWEYFGEAELPSINDIIATPIGGIAFGEITHRLSHLIIDESKRGKARVSREILAGIISPMDGFNRLIRGETFRYNPNEIKPHQPFLLDFSIFNRVMEDVDGNRSTMNLALGVRMVYGSLFMDKKRKPYDYFAFDFNLNFIGEQPMIPQASMIGLLWGQEWENKSHSYLFGAFQHFDYHDADPLVEGGRRPYEFAAPASFGLGFIYKYRPDENKRKLFSGGIYANVILLGASESDYYLVDKRDYNLGNGYSAKLHGMFIFEKGWVVSLGVKYFQIYTTQGYGSADYEINGLPEDMDFHSANVQGNKGFAQLVMTDARVDYILSKKFRLSLEQHYFFRNSHYDYFPNVKSNSAETRLVFTYNILNL